MSRSSPTTTSAVNEKRRPPLTTLATRLISTTRSWSSRPAEETERSREGISRSRLAGLEPQPALTGAVGERFNAPVILIAATVEHGLLDAGLLGALREQFADALGLLHRLQSPQLGLGPVDRCDRPRGVVVDQLHEQPAVGAKHGDPRPFGGPVDLGTHPAATLEPLGRLGETGHARLPTFRGTYSPS